MFIYIKKRTLLMVLVCILFLETAFVVIKINGAWHDLKADVHEEEDIAVPIVLYHSILEKDKINNRYCITPAELESDLEYIRDNGYSTITMTNLIDYVHDGFPLPEKPIILTFDDGFLNNYVYVLPLLNKYEMKAVESIIGSYTDLFSNEKSDNLVYSHLNWEQVIDMMQSGCFEIQNHTYALHSNNKGRVGAKMKHGESPEYYEKVLNEDIGGFQQLIQEKTEYTPNTFVYPYGEISKESVNILKNLGFKASLSTYGGINYINRNPEQLFGLKRNDRPSGISSRTFFKRIYSQ